MTEIIVRVHDERKAELLRELLASLDFVDIIESRSSKDAKGDDADFFALSGLWKDRHVTLELLRQQAWPRQ